MNINIFKTPWICEFPIIKGFSLWDPSAFAHKAIERRFLFFLRPEIRFVASVRSGSNL